MTWPVLFGERFYCSGCGADKLRWSSPELPPRQLLSGAKKQVFKERRKDPGARCHPTDVVGLRAGQRQGLRTGVLGIARLMLTRLSAITPRPTQRLMPASPLNRLRFSPRRRLIRLMRPSEPVRDFCPLRNEGFFCSRLRFGEQPLAGLDELSQQVKPLCPEKLDRDCCRSDPMTGRRSANCSTSPFAEP